MKPCVSAISGQGFEPGVRDRTGHRRTREEDERPRSQREEGGGLSRIWTRPGRMDAQAH